MLYVARRFLFIHIPRTAGNSISRSLVQELVEHSHPCLVCSELGVFERHSTANQLRKLLPDFDSLKKFAIDRPLNEIVESDYRLHKSSVILPESLPQWSLSVGMAQSETLDEFKNRRWVPWLNGNTPWEHWCCGPNGEDLGVQKFQFNSLKESWDKIQQVAGCQRQINLQVINQY
jgi:hypothetical protein